MTDPQALRTPFVLGKPIKNPADFYGRVPILTELFESVLNAELIALVGEHRCGNTSIMYQMLHPDVRERYLTPEQDHGLLFVLVSSQLAAEGPDALLRRIARVLRRSDLDSPADFARTPDNLWLEDYLEELSDRNLRLVLLVDEFEVLAGFEPRFWEWFQSLVTDYDVSMVVTTHTDLGQFRTVRQAGPPFFNMFRSIYVGSFSPQTVDTFLAEKSEITDFDFSSVRETIFALAGRYPYYLQVAAALFYLHAGGESHITPELTDQVVSEFKLRTSALLQDAWQKLPHNEREALTWLALGAQPGGEAEEQFGAALQSLERRGYVLDGRVFSTALVELVLESAPHVSLEQELGMARVGSRVVVPSPKALALLVHLVRNEGRTVAYRDLAVAVWPELDVDTVAHHMVDELAAELRGAIEEDPENPVHVEHFAELGYRFRNAPLSGPAQA